MRILHIIEGLSAVGPTRALIALVKEQRRLGLPYEHRVVSLRREAYPLALVLAKRAGLSVRRNLDDQALGQEIAAADIVQVNFWSSPALYRFLYANWPAHRLVIWFKVAGDTPPQIITPELVDYADFCVATSSRTLNLPALAPAVRAQCAETVNATPDFDRLAGCEPRAHDGFNVGYIGTVNFTKMHRDYLTMSAAVNLPDVRFVICGGEAQEQLRGEATCLGVADRFDFRGFVENIKPLLETFDVFGYPLCADTSATSELSLQEAMYAAVPPVIFPYCGLTYLVEHGQTGLVVDSPAEYTAAIEQLYHDPAGRQRLGQNARDVVRQRFAGGEPARQFADIYDRLLEQPRRARSWPGAAAAGSPAQRFVEALGQVGDPFARSLTAQDALVEGQIAASSPSLVSAEGGLLHYRNTYIDDPYLRFWSGLVLLHQTRYATAAAEFEAAVALGLDPARVTTYRDQAVAGLAAS